MKGQVIRSTGLWCEVLGEDTIKYSCRMKGKLRLEGFKETNPVAVGDFDFSTVCCDFLFQGSFGFGGACRAFGGVSGVGGAFRAFGGAFVAFGVGDSAGNGEWIGVGFDSVVG